MLSFSLYLLTNQKKRAIIHNDDTACLVAFKSFLEEIWTTTRIVVIPTRYIQIAFWLGRTEISSDIVRLGLFLLFSPYTAYTKFCVLFLKSYKATIKKGNF